MSNPEPNNEIKHYQWAGLDFMFDAEGCPVLLEANRSSHMLWEYLLLYKDDRPFRLIAEVLNAADGPICLMWRKGDPFPGADEDACWVAEHLRPYLDREPLICNVEDNQRAEEQLMTRDGRNVRPGAIFRWWYELPWSFERSGVQVINPNSVWVTVRDKLISYGAVQGAAHFRTPVSFNLPGPDHVERLMQSNEAAFRHGYVLKPKTGFGGHGVQVADAGDAPILFEDDYMLSERILPPPREGCFWDVRVFVMAGRYLGGVLRTNPDPVTNVFQGGTAGKLDDATAAALEAPALEAVQLLDAAATEVYLRTDAADEHLTRVEY